MDDRSSEIAALANAAGYDAGDARALRDGSPHIRHRVVRALFGRLLVRAVDGVRAGRPEVAALDLGAGSGTAALPLLALGARVTAVDVSRAQLDALREKCAAFADRLTARPGDAAAELLRLRAEGAYFDLVVANAFLHHVPDYLDLLERAVAVVAPGGAIFSFQDPLRYDSLGLAAGLLSRTAYVCWRVLAGGDRIAGIARRLRRARGVFREDCAADHVEYHVLRNGVDQDAIRDLLEGRGFECEIVRYFSTQSRVWQAVGAPLNLPNTFAVLARRR